MVTGSGGTGGRRIGAFKPVRAAAMTPESAEALAASALATLAAVPQRLSRFLADTGLAPADLQARAGERDVLVAVLDYVLADESLLLVVATEQRLRPEQMQQALTMLQAAAQDGP
jgi:hypothetical protein